MLQVAADKYYFRGKFQFTIAFYVEICFYPTSAKPKGRAIIVLAVCVCLNVSR